MLIPNLSVLLAERHLTISKVSADTGISRTTLTALSGRGARGIQFDTLNALCQYLRVTPNELFLYRPYDVAIDCEGLPDTAFADFTLTRAGEVELRCRLGLARELRAAPDRLRLRLTLPGADPDAARLCAVLQALPRPALAELEFKLIAPFDAHTPRDRDYIPQVIWPWEGEI